MIYAKFDVKEIEMALAYLKKHTNTVSIRIKFDEMGRLIFSSDDISANEIEITMFANGPDSKMAEVNTTQQLTEKTSVTKTERLTSG